MKLTSEQQSKIQLTLDAIEKKIDKAQAEINTIVINLEENRTNDQTRIR